MSPTDLLADRDRQDHTEPHLDVLLIDDDLFAWSRLVDDAITPHGRLICFDSPEALRLFLAGTYAQHLPPEPYAPRVALVDLNFRMEGPRGLEAVALLRGHPDVAVIIQTVEMSGGRDMAVRLAAELLGRPLLLSEKTEQNFADLAQLVKIIQDSAAHGLEVQINNNFRGLPLVKPLGFKGSANLAARPIPLGQYLFNPPWKGALWVELSQAVSFKTACDRAHIYYGQAAEKLGDLAVAWAMIGRNLLPLGPVLDCTQLFNNRGNDWRDATRTRAEHIRAFRECYQWILIDPVVQEAFLPPPPAHRA